MRNYDEAFQHFELMADDLILSEQQKYIARQLATIRLLEKYAEEFKKLIIEEEGKILDIIISYSTKDATFRSSYRSSNQTEFHIGDIVNYHSSPAYRGGKIESTGHKIIKIQPARPDINDTSELATLDNGIVVYVDYLSHV